MSDLRELYQEVIFDHNRRPRNFREMPEANRKVEGYNPLCGDRLTVYLRVEEDLIRDVSFHGTGCAISKASASLMTEAVKGTSPAEAEALFQRFHRVLTGEADAAAERANLGKLAALSGVAEFPMRVKCATLAWHALHSALSGADDTITTE